MPNTFNKLLQYTNMVTLEDLGSKLSKQGAIIEMRKENKDALEHIFRSYYNLTTDKFKQYVTLEVFLKFISEIYWNRNDNLSDKEKRMLKVVTREMSIARENASKQGVVLRRGLIQLAEQYRNVIYRVPINEAKMRLR